VIVLSRYNGIKKAKGKKTLDYKDASANAKNAVIPAWMPESRAREGDYPWHPYPI